MTDTMDAVQSAFHALEMPDADDLVVKSRLLRFVAEEIRRRGLTPQEVGDRLGLGQDEVTALTGERPSRFSVPMLMRLVGRLGFKVSIHVEGGGIAFDVPCQDAA
ncbi:helix-turn-helix transcriptional regulator [Methylobacterium sp. JK268]